MSNILLNRRLERSDPERRLVASVKRCAVETSTAGAPVITASSQASVDRAAIASLTIQKNMTIQVSIYFAIGKFDTFFRKINVFSL